MRILVSSLLLLTSTFSATASAQDVVSFPLDALGGIPLIPGTAEYQPNSQDLWGLVASTDLTMRDVPLPGYGSVELNLERIEADYTSWGIEVDGVPTPYDSLNQSIWKGNVTGDLTSEVQLTFSSHGCYGWITTGGEVYHLLPYLQPGLDWDMSSVRIVPETVMRTTGIPKGPFCVADTSRPIGQPGPPTYNNPVGTVLECKQAVETDFQFYNQWGNLAACQNYLTALLGAISDRYATQIDVVITYPYVQFYTNSNDPWTSQGGGPGSTLSEFRNAWAGNIPGGAHLAHFVSGVNGGGVAYLDVLCNSSWGFGVSFGVDGGLNFPVSQGNNTWDFVVIAHETGHNFGAPHTHDYCPTPLDRCAPSGYFGSCQSSQQCTNQGTVMSYCHLCSGGMNNITTYFHTQVETTMRNEAVNSCLPACNGCGGGGGGCTDDSHEPNNHCGEAVVRGVGSTTALVVDGSDRDFWEVAVPAGTTLTIDLTFTHSIGDINTFLYDNCFGNAGSGTSSNNNEQVSWTNNSASTVPIFVDVFLASSTGCNQYDLGVSISADPCTMPDDSYEDNDSCGQAAVLANGFELDMFVALDDKDYFTFCVADGATFTADLFFNNSSGDIDAYLYTSTGCDGTPVDQGSSSTNNESLSWTNTTGSDSEMVMKVEIWNQSPILCNSYVMQTAGIGGTCSGGGPGSIGSRYCDPAVGNSVGQSGRIDATGQLDVMANDLTLTASQLPSNQFGYFLGSMTPAAIVGPGGSMGVLCVGGNIARFVSQLGNSGAGGQLQAVIDLTVIPANPLHAIVPGETWNFTCWHRDVVLVQTSNFTDGVRITFQ